MAEELSDRVARLEEAERRAWVAIERLADKQEKLDDLVVLLTEAQIKNEERFRQTGERIDNLVSAIGEMLRTRNGGTH